MNIATYFPSWLLHIPLGWIVIGLLVFLLTLDAMRSGPARASVIVLTCVASVFLYGLIPKTYVIGGFISTLSQPAVMAGIFIALFIAVFLLIHRMTSTFPGASNGLMFSLLSGLSASIALVAAWQQVPALSGLWNFGSQVQSIFGSPFALPWLALTFVILAFVRS